MSFRLKPHLIGALSDAIQLRLDFLSTSADALSRGNPDRAAVVRAALVHEDMGFPSDEARVRLGLAHEIATTTFAEWWRRGRRVVEPAECDTANIGSGAYFMPLDQKASPYVHADLGMLEGAFITSEPRDDHRRWKMTLLFAHQLERDLSAMKLEELFDHQAGMVVTTWDSDGDCPEVMFVGSGAQFNDHMAIAALDDVWVDFRHVLDNAGPVFSGSYVASENSPRRL